MIRHKDYLLFTDPVSGGKSYFMSADGVLFGHYEHIDVPVPVGVTLAPGRWEYVGKGDSLTEEQWREIVDWYGVGDGTVDEAGVGDIFWCYDESDFCFDTGIKSGKSLLKYHNLNANQTVILKLTEE